ncbi:MAG: hypothetical protein RLN85_02875, partial [Pseudomonadales bacterium]
MSDEKPLKQSLKTMLEAESFSGQQLRDLNNLQSSQASKTKWFSQRRRLLTGGSAAIAASVLFVTGRNLFYDDDAIQEGIVREVLTNHIHIRKLDIETSSINEVASYFDRLAFAPFLSSQINRGSFELLGGRYCTLQGELASQ